MENSTIKNGDLEQKMLTDVHEGIKRFIEKAPTLTDKGILKRVLHWGDTDYTFLLKTSEGECMVMICYGDKKEYIVRTSENNFLYGELS